MEPQATPQPERVIRFRPRTILVVLAIVLSVAIALQVVWLARQVLSWVLISVFLALALNPAVEWFQRRGVRGRGLAAALTYLLTASALTMIGSLLIPTLVEQVNQFVESIPRYIEDLTRGRGRLGFLERDYQIVDRVREAVQEGGAARVLGVSGTALAITKSIVTAIVALVTITFMTFFMLLEGPAWVERFFTLLPEESRERWRSVGRDIYRTVGGYVTGNLLISLIAGVVSTLVLLILDVPYAVALGLVVALLDLIPLAGATLAAIIVSTVAILEDPFPAGVVVVIFFVVYQQLENHVLQPLVYGRTVELSPLAVLIAVLIGAELAGVLGALAAIPVAGTIQVILRDQMRARRERPPEPAAPI
ncbi:MAG: AI-2E family transporter [Actinomycetota bacterium]|nr:AI-2E family transporter [Actinomycetota bacterium]